MMFPRLPALLTGLVFAVETAYGYGLHQTAQSREAVASKQGVKKRRSGTGWDIGILEDVQDDKYDDTKINDGFGTFVNEARWKPEPKVTEQSNQKKIAMIRTQYRLSHPAPAGAVSESAGYDTAPQSALLAGPGKVLTAAERQEKQYGKVIKEYDTETDEESFPDFPMSRRKEKEEKRRAKHAQTVVQDAPEATKGKKPVAALGTMKLTTMSAHRRAAMDQCLSFANYLKGNGVKNIALISAWKNTCMPAVLAGKASPGFKQFCSSLGPALSDFAAVAAWDATELCMTVTNLMVEVELV